MEKHTSYLIIILLFLILFLLADSSTKESLNIQTTLAIPSEQTARCLSCHTERQPKLVEDWSKGIHASEGVGCYECHKANVDDSAARVGHFSFNVKIPVSPLICAECHPEQYNSFASSTHAMAFETIKSHQLADSSPIIFQTTCAACHGNDEQIHKAKPITNKWPNHGIGRINSDGSRGNCAACHGHHDSSVEQARNPQTCMKCHQDAVGGAYNSWKSSSHGAGYDKALHRTTHRDVSNTYPTCYTCHFASTSEKANNSTHNPSERLSWKIAAVQSVYNPEWGLKRMTMQATCKNCHASTQINQYYRRLDEQIVEFNKLALHLDSYNLSQSELELFKTKLISAKTAVAKNNPIIIRQFFDSIHKNLEMFKKKN